MGWGGPNTRCFSIAAHNRKVAKHTPRAQPFTKVIHVMSYRFYCHLIVGGWVPVRVEQDDAVCSDPWLDTNRREAVGRDTSTKRWECHDKGNGKISEGGLTDDWKPSFNAINDESRVPVSRGLCLGKNRAGHDTHSRFFHTRANPTQSESRLQPWEEPECRVRFIQDQILSLLQIAGAFRASTQCACRPPHPPSLRSIPKLHPPPAPSRIHDLHHRPL